VTNTTQTLGSLGTTIRGFPGFITEFLFYNSVPSAATQIAIRRNRGAYYGITVP